MSLKRTVAATQLPITLAEIKDHIRETRTIEDAPLMLYLRAVVDQLDGAAGSLNRCLVTQTWEWKIDRFWPALISVKLPPLQSVGSITYIDTNGDTQTLATSVYNVLGTNNETRAGRIELAFGESWPSTRHQADAVTITFTAGYGDRNSMPDATKALIMLMVAGAACERLPVAEARMWETPQMASLRWQATFVGAA